MHKAFYSGLLQQPHIRILLAYELCLTLSDALLPILFHSEIRHGTEARHRRFIWTLIHLIVVNGQRFCAAQYDEIHSWTTNTLLYFRWSGGGHCSQNRCFMKTMRKCILSLKRCSLCFQKDQQNTTSPFYIDLPSFRLHQAPYKYRVVVTHFSSSGVNRIVLLPVVLLLFKDA